MKPPTQQQLAELHAALRRAEEEHDVMVLAGGGTRELDAPVVGVPVEVFGVDELPCAELREKLEIWKQEPPPCPPRFVGLRPRRTR